MSVTINGTSGVTFNDASNQTTAATGFGFKNRILNGSMVIDQRNAGAEVNPAVAGYYLDRWVYFQNQTSKGKIGQNAGSVTPPVGFTNYLGFTSTSAYALLTADQFFIRQDIEGLNTADLAWGTASAATVTLSFWVRSSLTGSFGGAIQNSGRDRNYPFAFTINSANTWEYKTVTISGDTTGTWLTTNGRGITVTFSLGTGATYSATAGAWTGTSFITSATGATSVVGTNGATFYITGVQLEKGATATSFDYRPYGTELALCQRYYEVGGYNVQAATSAGGVVGGLTGYKVTKRATPTVTGTAVNGGSPFLNIRATNLLETINAYATPDVNGTVAGTWTSSAEL
jgi:hypothetical protein